MSLHPLKLLVVLALTGSAIGCPSMRPDLGAPGPMRQQQLRAVVHDPYPDQNLGPPVEGTRPREYQESLPEPVRTRLFRDRWWGGN